MRYFSMFSGIGGFEYGIQQASQSRASKQPGQPSRKYLQRSGDVPDSGRLHSRVCTGLCVGYSEIDKYAIKVYERHYDHKNYGNATTINASELPDFDLLVGGFPCQAFSVAGKRAGFNDTRGTLFFDIARILKEKKPRHLVLENVKGLLTHDKGATFQTILGVLADLGYRVEWQVLNSKDFGVPQNRERVFIVGHLRGECGSKIFPLREVHQEGIRKRVGRRSTHSTTISTRNGSTARGQQFVSTRWQRTEKGKQFRRESQRKGRDLTPFNDGYRELLPVPDKPSGTITSQAVAKDSLLSDFVRIRRLTPKECERLQGFPDDWTAGESDTQRYKMCGNAVTTNVITAIFEEGVCLV